MAELDPSQGMPLAPLEAARVNKACPQKLGYEFRSTHCLPPWRPWTSQLPTGTRRRAPSSSCSRR